jgi:hypothetical protein
LNDRNVDNSGKVKPAKSRHTKYFPIAAIQLALAALAIKNSDVKSR